MAQREHDRSPYIIGPEGKRLTRAKLPKPDARWTPKRKAQVVAAVAGGLLTVEDACAEYNLSMEELGEWSRLADTPDAGATNANQPPPRPPLEARADPCRDSTSISLTTAVPPPPERRAHARSLSILRVGKLRFDDGEELCRVRNISAGGMAVDLAEPRTVGETVSVEIGEGRPATGRIAWVQDNSAGIRFDEQIDIGLFLTRKAPVIGQVARPPRVSLTCPARITVGRYQYIARVRDISQGGIKLEIDDEQPLGTVVVISVDGLNARRGVVAWTRGTMTGVVFDQAIAFEELAEWLASRTRGRLPGEWGEQGHNDDAMPAPHRAAPELRAVG